MVVRRVVDPDPFTNPVKDHDKEECQRTGEMFNLGPELFQFHKRVPDLTY